MPDQTLSVKPRNAKNSARIASIQWCGSDRTRLWALAINGEVSELRPQSQPVGFIEGTGFIYNQARNRLVSFDRRALHIWTVGLHSLSQETFVDDILSVSWNSGGSRLAVALANGDLAIISTLNPYNDDVIDHVDTISYADNSDPIARSLARWVTADPVWVDDETIAYVYAGTDLVLDNVVNHGRLWVDDAHNGHSISAICSLSGHRIMTTGIDGTARILNSHSASITHVYESPSGFPLVGASVGRFRGQEIACAIGDEGSLQIFPLNQLNEVIYVGSKLPESEEIVEFAGFSGNGRYIAAAGVSDKAYIWSTQTILQRHREATTHYKNAKVVLVGDTGVGKSGLALRLTGEGFAPTESTHGRNVISITRETVREGYQSEQREVHLWDLAGQPGYRVFHQLSMREVSVGVLVIDSRSESNPFRGVGYWSQALESAAASQSAAMHRVLVAARSDRGRLSASPQRIEQVAKQGGFACFLETSAKTGESIEELRSEILRNIDWGSIAAVVAPGIFIDVRKYLIELKQYGLLIMGESELREGFIQRGKQVSKRVFEVCLQRLETAGLVSRLAPGVKWLLQPELLDKYVASLAQAARSEPDGLGSIAENEALSGNYEHEVQESVSDESVMLLAAVQEVVERGIALRVPTDRGQMLTFPSELLHDFDEYPGGYEREVRITFRGPIVAIYAAITVRLLNSLVFGSSYSLFKDAALFLTQASNGNDDAPETCGYVMRFPNIDDESVGELEVFFSSGTSADRKLSFLRYVDFQLRGMALPHSVARRRIYRHCGIDLPDEAIAIRQNRGHHTALCAVCGSELPLEDLNEGSLIPDRSRSIARQAIAEQARQGRLVTLDARRANKDFDVFICYNTADRPAAQNLYDRLTAAGFSVWMDTVGVNDRVISEIDGVLRNVRFAIIAFGPNSVGVWQEHEYFAILSQAILRSEDRGKLDVIPVLLAGSVDIRDLPPMMQPFRVVDLRGDKLATGMAELTSRISGTL